MKTHLLHRTGIALFAIFALAPAVTAQERPKTAAVERGDIIQRLNERGTLESSRTADLACTLPNRTKQGFATTIKWVIDDGTMVKKGDKLATLDDAPLREAIHQQELEVAQRQAALADEEMDIKLTFLGAQRELLAAESNLEFVLLEQTGGAKQLAIMKRQLEARVKKAELALKLARVQADKKATEESKLAVAQAEVDRELAELELKQVIEGEAMQKRKIQRYLEVAKLELEAVKLLAERRRRQTEVRSTAAKVAVEQEKAKLEALHADLARCVWTAPMDGLVVYYIPEQTRAGPGQPIIAAGEPVRDGQKLLRLCDLGAMQLQVRIPEAQVASVRPGQPVRVRVDAYPDRVLVGQVAQVSPVAEARDWRAANVKVYATQIALPGHGPGLKPGMSAAAVISLREVKNVLRVPVSALTLDGNAAICLVKTDQKQEKRRVTVGASDGQFVEIKDGLQEGEKVVLKPSFGER